MSAYGVNQLILYKPEVATFPYGEPHWTEKREAGDFL